MNLELKADVSEEFSGNRLDRFLKYSLGDEISRATIQKWIEAGYVQGQDGKILDKSSWKVKTGEKYLLSIPPNPSQFRTNSNGVASHFRKREFSNHS